jgi:hypothetical protein
LGNPPFVGFTYQTVEQKDDLESVMKGFGKNIDYVAGWYYKAAQMMQGTQIKAALVSTNSITQGEQVAAIWKPMFEHFGMHFDFAWRTFRWDSEANIKAHVHCVIIGFSCFDDKRTKKIYLNESQFISAKNINGYLLDAPDMWIQSRTVPLADVPEMVFGSMANDSGNLILSPEERDEYVSKYPQIEPYIKSFLGAEEFINNKSRYCLWLVDCPPSVLRTCPHVMDRVAKVREARAASTRPGTRKMADYPTLFGENRQPESNYLLVPRVSSEKRRYVPMGFLSPDIIASDAVQIIPNASLYHFGVLTSNVHMAWMRVVCGRLEMRYRYSKDIVYNNFPWCQPTEEQKARIEATAQAILDARAKYPDCSLADLYDEVAMPPELRKAHQDNDRAVMQAYGFVPGKTSESECVARLFEMYQELTK